jgi:hypothetical protein
MGRTIALVSSLAMLLCTGVQAAPPGTVSDRS